MIFPTFIEWSFCLWGVSWVNFHSLEFLQWSGTNFHVTGSFKSYISCGMVKTALSLMWQNCHKCLWAGSCHLRVILAKQSFGVQVRRCGTEKQSLGSMLHIVLNKMLVSACPWKEKVEFLVEVFCASTQNTSILGAKLPQRDFPLFEPLFGSKDKVWKMWKHANDECKLTRLRLIQNITRAPSTNIFSHIYI